LREKSTRRSPHDGKYNGVNENRDETRLTREEHGRDGRKGQKDTRAQEDEPKGGNNEVRGSHREFENKIDDGPVEEGKDEGVKQNLDQEARTRGQGQEETWTQDGKKDSGHQNLGTCNVNHVYCRQTEKNQPVNCSRVIRSRMISIFEISFHKRRQVGPGRRVVHHGAGSKTN